MNYLLLFVNPNTLKWAFVLSSLSIVADPVILTLLVKLGVSEVETKYTLKLLSFTDAVAFPLIIKLIADIDAYPIIKVNNVINNNNVICNVFFILKVLNNIFSYFLFIC